jgi:hypothetical protein
LATATGEPTLVTSQLISPFSAGLLLQLLRSMETYVEGSHLTTSVLFASKDASGLVLGAECTVTSYEEVATEFPAVNFVREEVD